MKFLITLLTLIVFQFIPMENRSIKEPYALRSTTVGMSEMEILLPIDESAVDTVLTNDEVGHEKVIGLQETNEKESEDYSNEDGKQQQEPKSKEPCAIVVISNVQNPAMPSLIRKYRYDANGALIPSSVKYFIKSSQGMGLAPVLMPLNDKAFSPLGGFVRYYKEVPPIPHAW